MTAFSRRTQNNDSFAAAPKILPLNDFSHFARCVLVRDLTARPTLRFGDLGRTAHSRACGNPHEYAISAGP
jgi:hypothetical protein